VRITTAVLGDQAVLDVCDNGPPIASDEIEAVFKPFGVGGRLHGAGVGLAISKRIAKELGGQIEVSTTDEHETRFRLTLPSAGTGSRPA
jgi:signal transduction histidine kinase